MVYEQKQEYELQYMSRKHKRNTNIIKTLTKMDRQLAELDMRYI